MFVETYRFRPDDPQHCASQAVQLPVAAADTGKLSAAALCGLAAIWRGGFNYKKAGFMFLDLVPAASVQGGLFDAPDTPTCQKLMAIIDRLYARHGRDTISFARSGRQRAWKLRSIIPRAIRQVVFARNGVDPNGKLAVSLFLSKWNSHQTGLGFMSETALGGALRPIPCLGWSSLDHARPFPRGLVRLRGKPDYQPCGHGQGTADSDRYAGPYCFCGSPATGA